MYFPDDLETIGLDWESYWSATYSLTKLSTSEYVRDRRFRAHGVGIARGSQGFKPYWVSHDDVPAALAEIPWERVRLVSHNMEFDGLVLAERYGYRPKQYFCTMSAARFWHQGETKVGLDALAQFLKLKGKKEGLAATKGLFILPPDIEATLAEYCKHDTITALMFYLEYKDKLPPLEQYLMDLTFRMFCDPVLEVDLELVREGFKDALRARIAKVDAADWVDSSVLRSSDKFANALMDLGVEPPTKISKTTGKRTWAFAKGDESFTELLDHEDERVRTLVEARIASKSTIGLSRALRLFRMGRTGKLAVALNYGRAKTHRWSGSNKMNLQNFVRGSKLRKAIRAPKGWLVGAADSANIEGRGNAWWCGEESVLDMYRRKEDLYNAMASIIYGRPIDRKRVELDANGNEYEPDFVEGFVGKTAELGLGYRMGGPKFQLTCRTGKVKVDLDLDFCVHVVNTWRRQRPFITNMWYRLDDWCHLLAAGSGAPVEWKGVTLVPTERRIWFPNGTSMYYPDCQFGEGGEVMYRDLYTWKNLHGGKLLENIIQKLSRDVIAEQIAKVSMRYKVATMTHDEIVWACPESEADESKAFVIDIMSTPTVWAPEWPLGAEAKLAPNYSK